MHNVKYSDQKEDAQNAYPHGEREDQNESFELNQEFNAVDTTLHCVSVNNVIKFYTINDQYFLCTVYA